MRWNQIAHLPSHFQSNQPLHQNMTKKFHFKINLVHNGLNLIILTAGSGGAVVGAGVEFGGTVVGLSSPQVLGPEVNLALV